VAATVDPEDRAEPDAAEELAVQVELAVLGALVVQAAQAVVDPDTAETETATTVATLVVKAAAKAVTAAMVRVVTTVLASQVRVGPVAVVPQADAPAHPATESVASGNPVKVVPHVRLATVNAASGNLVRAGIVLPVLPVMASVVSGSLARVVHPIVARLVTETADQARAAATAIARLLVATDNAMSAQN
jgi:hypothetical protein